MDDREVFFQVVRANGFTAAARRLDTSAASVSRRVSQLEQRLGVRLLERTTRKIRLTEAGERYFHEAQQLLQDMQNLEQTLTHEASQLQGGLRVVAPMSFGQRRVAPLVSRFARLHPGLRISLILEDRETDLMDEPVDVAIRIGYPTDSSMVARFIGHVATHLCASGEYLKRRGRPEQPADLLRHDCLHYNIISEREEWTFPGHEDGQSLAIRGSFCSNNGDVLLEAACQGLGIARLPDFIVAEGLADGRLVKVLEAYEWTPLSLFALYPSRRYLPLKTRRFLDYLQTHLTLK